MAEAGGKMDIGRVLTNTFGVISRNPVVFLGLSFLVVAIPQALLQLAMGVGDPADQAASMVAFFESPALIISGIAGWFVLIILSVLLQATFIVATVNDLGGRPVNIGECITQALRKLLPLIGLGILFTIGIMVGFVLLVIPGIILYLMWIIAAPVMMAEDKGILDSFKRSAELTKGSKRWILLLLIIFFVLAMIIGGIGGAIGIFSASAAIIVGLITNTIVGSLQSAGIASIYVDLRTAKEGTDTGTLADVFS